MRYQRSRSAGSGAEPLPALRTWSSPRPASTFLPTTAAMAGLASAASSWPAGICASTACWNLVHKRGTEMKLVGCARFTSAMKVASESLKNTWVSPEMKAVHSIQARSKVWASGR